MAEYLRPGKSDNKSDLTTSACFLGVSTRAIHSPGLGAVILVYNDQICSNGHSFSIRLGLGLKGLGFKRIRIKLF